MPLIFSDRFQREQWPDLCNAFTQKNGLKFHLLSVYLDFNEGCGTHKPSGGIYKSLLFNCSHDTNVVVS